MDWRLSWLAAGVLLSLLVAAGFGHVYNKFVTRIEEEWEENSATADLVVFGVTVVLLLSAPIVGVWQTIYLFGMFAAAGAFMAYGSKHRYNKRRREAGNRLSRHIDSMVEGALDEDKRGNAS